MIAVTIEKHLRPCIVDGKKALFHDWSHISRIKNAILTGTVSGVVSETFAIVEYEDGTVENVYPSSIKFCDNEFSKYIFNTIEENGI